MNEDNKRLAQDLSLGVILGVMVGLAAILVVLFSNVIGFIRYARGHDHWINHNSLKHPITQELCCGENDCEALVKDDVKPRRIPGGFLIPQTGERIYYPEVTWGSKDGEFWRCRYLEEHVKPRGKATGDTRCLIAPMPNS